MSLISRIAVSSFFLPLFNLFIGLGVVVMFITYDFVEYSNKQKDMLLSKAASYTDSQAGIINAFTSHSRDLIESLNNSKSLRHYLETGAMEELRELLDFTIHAESYLMQARYINAKGLEVIRFDRKHLESEPFEVSKEHLQDKSNRDYVQANINRPSNTWFSVLDLNVERGKVEFPFNPTFRTVLPVWHKGEFKGMFVLNYFAQLMLDSMLKTSDYDIKMLDSEGYTLDSSGNEGHWSRFAENPYTVEENIKASLSENGFIGDSFAMMPLPAPFQNRLWLMMMPSKAYIATKTLNEREHIRSVALIIGVVTVLINLFLFFILRRLNLRLEDSAARMTAQQALLDQQKKIVEMNKILDRYVITSSTNLKGIITDVSEAFCQISGYAKEELIGHSHRIVRHPDMPSSLYKQMWETIMSDRTWRGEIKNRTQNGGYYWVKAIISPHYDDQGNKIGYTAVRMDITHEKRLLAEEEAHKAASLRMELALQAGNVGVWEWDFASNTLLWDERMCEIYGINSTQGPNNYTIWSNAIDPDDKPRVEANLKHAVEHNGEYSASFWITTPEGERRYIQALGKNEISPSGQACRMVGINTDITEHKLLEDHLSEMVGVETAKRLEQEKLLIQQSKLASMGEMIANIAHQWRQPLMMLSMGMLALHKKFNKGMLDAEYLDAYNAKTSVLIERMNKTIDDFAHYFKPEKQSNAFSLSECIDRNIDFLAPIAEKYSILVNFTAEEDDTVTNFESELSQVLLNLIKNSIDAIVEKEIGNGTIDVSVKNETKYFVIRVEDNAGGIPEDIINRVFEPYFTTKFKSDGTGIGLYMSKMIVESSLGGSLGVKNSTKGAIFTITLPKEITHVTR